jgi:sialic acid synthase SpsE
MDFLKIGNTTVGDQYPPYFIADIGANHDGSLDRAFRLIELAKEAGANAAKFQNFQAHKIVSNKGFIDLGGKLSHQSKWKKSVYEVYKDASIPFDWTELLKNKCDKVGIEYFTSPYDFESVDNVDPFVNVYKIGSGDITWIELIEYIGNKKKPVLVASGASSMEDVERCMGALLPITHDIVLMQCNTNYTGSANNFRYINLNVFLTFKQKYPGTILGLSDHTYGHTTVLGALALGARVFEKHFTDDNGREGPDHKFAMNPQTWREMVDKSNELYQALGDGVKRIEENEMDSIVVQRRSVRVIRDISKGERISASDLEVLRPMPLNGFPPFKLNGLIGKIAKENIVEGEHLTAENILL